MRELEKLEKSRKAQMDGMGKQSMNKDKSNAKGTAPGRLEGQKAGADWLVVEREMNGRVRDDDDDDEEEKERDGHVGGRRQKENKKMK